MKEVLVERQVTVVDESQANDLKREIEDLNIRLSGLERDNAILSSERDEAQLEKQKVIAILQKKEA